MTTKGKECCSNVSRRLWGGALLDRPKNGCEGDYLRMGLPAKIKLPTFLIVGIFPPPFLFVGDSRQKNRDSEVCNFWLQ